MEQCVVLYFLYRTIISFLISLCISFALHLYYNLIAFLVASKTKK